MNALSVARKAVFGETWALPIAVALLLGAAVAIRPLLPGLWEDAGGPFLIAGAVLILFALTRPAHA